MNILIVPDKFKGSATAIDVAKSIEKGIKTINKNTKIAIQPMADGGDGSIDLLNAVYGLEEHKVLVNNPLFRSILATYFTNSDTAFIEMSKASGLALLKKEEQNCLKTTSQGTGKLILDAYEKGFRKIKLFIGGSATNDAGIGIATALGYCFYDKNDNIVIPIGGNLSKIYNIKSTQLTEKIRALDIEVICDVNNPFYGKNGAAYVFAKQKGADRKAIETLDYGLQHINRIFVKNGFTDVQNIAGAGAAGGIGGGMIAFFNAQLTAGIDMFIELFNLEKKVKNADLVITGEGRLDTQSFDGKVVGGLYKLCKKHQKSMIVVCGQVLESEKLPLKNKQIYTVIDQAENLENAINNPLKYLETIGQTIEQSNI
ncbi:MAG: glycerate kinase [Saprospiraceae bacterium]